MHIVILERPTDCRLHTESHAGRARLYHPLSASSHFHAVLRSIHTAFPAQTEQTMRNVCEKGKRRKKHMSASQRKNFERWKVLFNRRKYNCCLLAGTIPDGFHALAGLTGLILGTYFGCLKITISRGAYNIAGTHMDVQSTTSARKLRCRSSWDKRRNQIG